MIITNPSKQKDSFESWKIYRSAEVIFMSPMDDGKEKEIILNCGNVLVMTGDSKEDVINSTFQLLLTNYQKKMVVNIRGIYLSSIMLINSTVGNSP